MVANQVRSPRPTATDRGGRANQERSGASAFRARSDRGSGGSSGFDGERGDIDGSVSGGAADGACAGDSGGVTRAKSAGARWAGSTDAMVAIAFSMVFDIHRLHRLPPVTGSL